MAPKQHEAAREILEQALREGPEALRFPAFLGIMNFAPEIALPVIDDVLDTIQPVHLGNICFRLSQRPAAGADFPEFHLHRRRRSEAARTNHGSGTRFAAFVFSLELDAR